MMISTVDNQSKVLHTSTLDAINVVYRSNRRNAKKRICIAKQLFISNKVASYCKEPIKLLSRWINCAGKKFNSFFLSKRWRCKTNIKIIRNNNSNKSIEHKNLNESIQRFKRNVPYFCRIAQTIWPLSVDNVLWVLYIMPEYDNNGTNKKKSNALWT